MVKLMLSNEPNEIKPVIASVGICVVHNVLLGGEQNETL